MQIRRITMSGILNVKRQLKKNTMLSGKTSFVRELKNRPWITAFLITTLLLAIGSFGFGILSIVK